MFSRRNHVFFLTCASIFSLAVLSSHTVSAGFEWTPPAQEEPEPDFKEPSAPAGSALPIPPVSVEQEILPKKVLPKRAAPQIPMKAQTPVIKTKKIVKPAPVAPAPAMPPVKSPEIAQKQVQPNTIQAEKVTRISRKNIVPTQAPSEQPVVSTQSASAQPQMSKVAEKKENIAVPKRLKINPYPSETATTQADKNEKATAAIPTPKKLNESIKWNKGVDFPVVEGFGSDIPLAMALSQIVPPEYAYAFGDGVNAGHQVSWNGGKPWNEVLADVLAPLNMSFEIRGKKIILKRAVKQASLEKKNNPLV